MSVVQHGLFHLGLRLVLQHWLWSFLGFSATAGLGFVKGVGSYLTLIVFVGLPGLRQSQAGSAQQKPQAPPKLHEMKEAFVVV